MAQNDAAPLVNPVAIIGPQYCCPYPVDLAIVRNVMTCGEGTFAVSDDNGNLLFKVNEKQLIFAPQRKTILDPAGNPIITLRSKPMSAHSRWQVFRGESADQKDLIFSVKIHSIFQCKTKLDVFLANNTAEEVCDYLVKGSFSQRSCVVYAGDEKSNTIVAQMQKKNTAKSLLWGKDNCMVTVYPNIDYAFIVALIVILDDINSGSGSSG